MFLDHPDEKVGTALSVCM